MLTLFEVCLLVALFGLNMCFDFVSGWLIGSYSLCVVLRFVSFTWFLAMFGIVFGLGFSGCLLCLRCFGFDLVGYYCCGVC